MDEIVDQYKKELVKVNEINNIESFKAKCNQKEENLVNVELEIKLHNIDRNTFESFIDIFKMSNIEYEKSINIIKNNDANKESIIRTIVFDGDKKSEINGRKRLLQNKRFKINECEYKVSLSLEDKYMVKSTAADIVRIKFRKSKIITVSNYQWSLDLTCVYSTTDVMKLKEIKEKVFGAENILDFPDIAYEIELELKNGNTQFSLNDLNTGVKLLLSTINPNYENTRQLAEELGLICAQMGIDQTDSPTIKKIFPKVVSITRNEYSKIYPPVGYYITDKLDGKRAILSIHHGKGCIITDKITEIDDTFDQKWTILDGEYYNGEFYAFDAIIINDEQLFDEKFSTRIDKLQQYKNKHVKVKKYTFITATVPSELEKEITQARISDEKTDGYIITKDGDGYMDTLNYKYKDLEHNTIDFLAKLAPEKSDIPGFTLYYLFVGITRRMFNNLKLRYCINYQLIFDIRTFGEYFPIQFSSCNMPYAYKYYRDNKLEPLDIDGKVVELLCVENCGSMSTDKIVKWKEIGIREDRKNETNYYGNDYRIAELTWLNFIDPFTKEELWNGVKDIYFATEKESMYEAQITYVSFCKNTLITDLLNEMTTIIDIGAGKGQDLGRYYKAKVKNLYAIDKDRAALSELIQRRLTGTAETAVNVMVADMNDDYKLLVERMKSHFNLTAVDAIVCNLAVHYFLGSKDEMTNFVLFCERMLKSGGIVILTCFFGEKIHDLPAEWDIYQDNVLKYSIKKEYVGDTLGIGQKIGVKLPFSNGEYYSENLVNTEELVKEFKSFGFSLKSKKSLLHYMNDFKARNHATAALLTEDDKKYIELYGEIVVTKK